MFGKYWTGKIIAGMTVFFAVIMLLSLSANAATLSFNGTDTVGDVTFADADITGAGAYTEGIYQYFYITVRGSIPTAPPDGDTYTYTINIETSFTTEYVSIALTWYTSNGVSYHSYTYGVNSSSFSVLDDSDVTIYGNKVTVRIPALVLSDVTVENVEFATAYFGNDGLGGDTYTYYPSSGGSDSGSSTDTTYTSNSIGFLFLSGVVFFVCIGVWIIIWLLVALWAYKDAKKRGADSPILWFFVVLFLGLIGLIVYIIVRPKQEQSNMPPPPPPPQQYPPPPQ